MKGFEDAFAADPMERRNGRFIKVQMFVAKKYKAKANVLALAVRHEPSTMNFLKGKTDVSFSINCPLSSTCRAFLHFPLVLNT